MKEIANTIRLLRLKHHMTQAQLASKLGVQFQTVSKWETGTTIPDTAMLPRIADFFGVSIDELFGRKQPCRFKNISGNNTEFLLRTYSEMYGPEAGPWNLSVANRYLEYKFADFFEKNFLLSDDTSICNIGIGAGEWDRYLSYKLRNGSLTSIDREEICCRQLVQRLICEGNPNDVRVMCADAMTLDLAGMFEIVTMVGSTGIESGAGISLFEKAASFVKPGGAIYYQSIDEKEDCNAVLQAAYRHGMNLAAFLEDQSYGFCCRYYKFERSGLT